MATKNDEELAQLEAELRQLEEMSNSKEYGSPEPEKKDNMFKFFREVLHLKEAWKVGNLKDEEIGKTVFLPVKPWLELARYAEAEGMDKVQQYFIDRAEIVAAPTMGRKGFMSQLFVTQIKKEQKLRTPNPVKRSWFGGAPKQTEEPE